MNRFWNLRRGIILSLFVALALNGLARPVENRYLFIVETSSAMKRDSAEAQRILLDLVFSGLHGRMKLNDSFGVWTYSTHLQGHLPMQYWIPEDKYSIAQNVAEFIKEQKFKGEGHLEEPLLRATAIANASSNLTVIIISDGKEPVTGTPFDHDIADLQKKYRDDLYKSKIPFVTVLVANEGKWIDYSVNSSIGSIQIPEIPLPPPPPVVAPPTVAAAPPPRKKVEPLILIWPKTNAAKSTAESSAAKAATPAPVAVTNNASPVATSTPLNSETNNPAPVVITSTPIAAPPVALPSATPPITQPVPVTAAAPQSQAALPAEKPTTPATPTAVAASPLAAPAPVAAPPVAIANQTAPPTDVKVTPPAPNAAMPAPVAPAPVTSSVLAKEPPVSATPPSAPVAPAAPTPSSSPEEKATPPIAAPVAATPTPPSNNKIILITAVLAFIGAGTLLLMRVFGRKKTSSLITQSLRRQDHHDAVN